MSNLYQDSLQLTHDVRGYLDPIQRRDAQLARRLKRASDGVVRSMEESLWMRGRQKRKHVREALGHAMETSACLRAAESIGYVDEVDAGLIARLQTFEGALRAA